MLLVGALATADVGLDFDGTDFAFLEESGRSCSARRVVVARSCVAAAGREDR